MPSQDPHIEVERDRDNDKDRDRDKDREQDNERSERAERSSSKQRPSASQKTKDLSHVPCKFFKVGACTAGSSCPFSHAVPEPGHKEACAWFVKGNCKFGHKCALAHVMPGQSMAMDRKNKKAAQAAATAAAVIEKGATGSKEAFKDVSGKNTPRKRDGHQNALAVVHGGMLGGGSTSQSGSGRNTALFSGGSTAPTRILRTPVTSTRPPINMPLKAPISPSAPAPSLQDTDFSSFAAFDQMEGVDVSEKPDQDGPDSDSKDEGEREQPVSDGFSSSDRVARPSKADGNVLRNRSKPPSPVPLPTSAPRISVPLTVTDFGPIGSPPSTARLNGALANRKPPGALSPGTPPRSNGGAAFLQQRLNHEISLSPPSGRNNQPHLASSPFSAPGAQSIFLSSSLNTGEQASGPGFVGGTAGRDSSAAGAFNMGGIAASLNSGIALMRGYDDGLDDFGSGISKGRHAGRGFGAKPSTAEQTIGDDDLEELIPSSLSDLLTPEEKRRRMSRSSHQSQAQGTPVPTSKLVNPGESLATGTSMGHRYSRSVPAPSLLGDVKSIWADTAGINQRRGTPTMAETEDISLQVPTPALNGGGNPIIDELGLSMSMGSSSSLTTHINAGLSPSNASAAFLPGLHHHYLKAKQQAQLSLAVGPGSLAAPGRQNSGSGPTKGIRTASGPLFPAASTVINSTAGNVGVHTQGGISQTYRMTPSPFDMPQHQHQYHNRNPGGLGQGGTDGPLNHYISSPSARALQAHAPGQSLPQGLAAGLSRIHQLPPLPSLTSPGTSLTIDANHGLTTSRPYEERKPAPSPGPNILGRTQATPSTTAGDLVGTIVNGPNANVARTSYSSVTRVAGANIGSNNPSPPASARPTLGGGHYQPVSGTALSRPTEDDELFIMDGE